MTVTTPLNSSLSTPDPTGGRRLDWQVLAVPISLVVGVLAWQGLVWINNFPAFILPSPLVVANRLGAVLADGTLVRHTLVTLGESLSGLLAGLVVAAVLGYVIGQSRTMERLIAPYIVASQSIPIVAIAPLMVIWFGSGLTSKVLVCALIVFFPVLINVIVGVRSVEPDLRDMLRSLKASRWQTFINLELPAALPLVLGGLKIGATLSVIGAVVGEFSGSNSGLGFLITAARGQFDTPLVFVAVLALVAVAMVMYGAVAVLERYWLGWKN